MTRFALPRFREALLQPRKYYAEKKSSRVRFTSLRRFLRYTILLYEVFYNPLSHLRQQPTYQGKSLRYSRTGSFDLTGNLFSRVQGGKFGKQIRLKRRVLFDLCPLLFYQMCGSFCGKPRIRKLSACACEFAFYPLKDRKSVV